jgi:hypothetical protein
MATSANRAPSLPVEHAVVTPAVGLIPAICVSCGDQSPSLRRAAGHLVRHAAKRHETVGAGA